MAVKIAGSVGKKGKNKPDDIEKIQKLLNTHKSKAGFSTLKVDKMIGKKCIVAIETFQKKIVGIKSDGRVDPGGKTITALNGKPGAAPASAEDTKSKGAADEEDDEAMFKPEILKATIKKVTSSPHVFAFGLSSKPELCVLVLKKKASGRALAQVVKKVSGLSKVTFGMASQDEKSKDTLVFELEGKQLAGLAKMGTKFLKNKKLAPFKQVKLSVDGNAVDDLTDDEDLADTKIKSRLSGSVGKGGKNLPDDVKSVQLLLNKHGESLTVDGIIGSKTIQAITKFQQNKLGFTDGRVDPDGKTWQALNGGKVQKGTGGGSGGPATTDQGEKRVTEEIVKEDSEEEAPKKPRREGIAPWFDAETEISTPSFSIKVETDAHGNVKGGSLSQNLLPSISESLPLGPYHIGFTFKPLELEIAFKGTGPRFPVTGKIGIGGAGHIIFGGGRKGIIVGIKTELGLSISTKVFTGMVDLEKRDWSFEGTKFPIKISLKAEIKAGAVFIIKDFEASHMIPIKSYPKLVIAVIDSDLNVTIKPGRDFDRLKQDLEDTRQFILDNPTAAGTGPPPPLTPEEIEEQREEPEKAKSASEDINRVGKEAQQAADKLGRQIALETCRQVESGMNAAFQQGWQDPNLVGKANALNQQDTDMAKTIYGNAWTQRALAKQAHDQYSSPIESNPVSIIEARTAQAHNITQKFQTAISLFSQGDASW